MIRYKRLVKMWGFIILILNFPIKSAFTQKENQVNNTTVSSHIADSCALMEVIFKVSSGNNENGSLQYLQTDSLLRMDGVRYVGINYRSKEVIVRYFASKVSQDKILSTLKAIANSAFVVVEDPRIVDSEMVSKSPDDRNNVLSPDYSKLHIKCITHQDAHTLCKEHLNIDIREQYPLENCYVVQVNFQTKNHIDITYDWLSQAFLVDDKGELIKPLTWLELPLIKENRERGPISGLLIFPKIPLLKLGLNLRLLRANGDGYDSYNVDVQQVQNSNERR